MPFFDDFPLLPTTHAVLTNMQITEPTPIQAETIPVLLAGSDVVGQSATGSGKTLAYGIPLVERVAQKERAVQALILVPTRELAVQVGTVLSQLTSNRRISIALLVGGRSYSHQFSALRYGSQIVVGTPGRVKDHLERGTLVLNRLRMCVLDEADQMLDSGFAPAIEEILATTPDTRQMALFSATIPAWVEELQKKFLKDPVNIAISSAMGGPSTIEQIAYQVPHNQKIAALCTLLHAAQGESSLIFGRTKFGVEKLGQQLSELGFAVETLHGDKSQRARENVLTAFRRGHVQTLLATNVAARGLDIQGISQVINYELPESSELFTHRVGRTGRMGRQGRAITLLVPSDLPKWRHMVRRLGQAVPLQRLTIDVEAVNAVGPAIQEIAIISESEPRAFRNRKQAVADQERELQPMRGRKQAVVDREREPQPMHSRQQEVTEREMESQPVRSRKQAVADREREPQPMRNRKQVVADREREPQPMYSRQQEVTEREMERRGARGRMPFSSRREHGRSDRFVQSQYESYLVADLPRPRPERATRGGSRWQGADVSLPARPFSRRGRDAGRRSSFANAPRKSRAHPFTATEAQPYPVRKKPVAISPMRPRRAKPAKRAARY